MNKQCGSVGPGKGNLVPMKDCWQKLVPNWSLILTLGPIFHNPTENRIII
jgi:hypothetical protein